jgi:hypothetical protein
MRLILRELIVDAITVIVMTLLLVMYYENGIGCLTLLNVLAFQFKVSLDPARCLEKILEHAVGAFPEADYAVWAKFSS